MTRTGWLQSAGTAVALALGIMAFSWARGVARPGPNDRGGWSQWPAAPPSAGLLRRLAESADAFRTGQVVYIVAKDSGTYPVLGVFPAFPVADSARGRAGGGWAVYPTLTRPDAGITAQIILPGCYKDYRTTWWICPPADSAFTPPKPFPAMRLQDLRRVEIRFVPRTGGPVTVSVAPQNLGATIYTIDAFDRVIVPYYTRLFGPAHAARMRDSLLAYVRNMTTEIR